MSAFVSTLSALWAQVATHARAFLIIPDREPVDYGFVESDVAQLHRLCPDPARGALDDATWKDLLLDTYRAHLSAETSIFGQQVLYKRLRAGLDDGACAAVGERVRGLMRDPARLAALHRDCTSLRHADKEIATLLFEDAAPPLPWWVGKTWPLPILLLASIAAVIVTPAAWLATGAVAYLLMSTQMRYHERVEAWQRSMNALQMLLRVSSILGARGDAPLQPFAGAAAAAGKLNRQLSRAPLVRMTPGASVYLDWFMLDNVNHYFKGVRLVHGHLDFLRACLARVGELEADIALARHLLGAPALCWAERHARNALALEATVHPLLPQAQALSVVLDGGGAFISGQNGIGKSTLLRTVGLNLATARAFGFCYARRASVPDLPVYTSMQSEDSLFGGESLYMAELRRAQELLAAADGPHPGICIIDEIFRGTNHLESVSAAASVLDVLAAKGLVIVSSHNLVLASLLAHRLAPLCVRLDAGGRLALEAGVLAHTNGIALLAQRGFGRAVEERADRVFDWLNGYLAHPGDCDGVLARAPASDAGAFGIRTGSR
ncbi:hypothetical protein HF313_04000 [Massilia atriviolacea]|uniref:DNA mismatch repair protein MutS n=1 Tax=Massilia atriviolacea TaxID=2495579 RepID=A0A430HE25_9BURK|nr:hypothetical protein [Massilia atriviolacea]RSZ55773.1 hypothetical protein EJB06_27425 [Massilia atriviolacea]